MVLISSGFNSKILLYLVDLSTVCRQSFPSLVALTTVCARWVPVGKPGDLVVADNAVGIEAVKAGSMWPKIGLKNGKHLIINER